MAPAMMASLRSYPTATAVLGHCSQRTLSPSPAASSTFASSKSEVRGLKFLAGKAARGRFSRFSMSIDVQEDETAGVAKSGNLEVPAPFEEKFAVLDTGKWECKSCGYVYDQDIGDKSYPIAAGTDFKRLPSDWVCPTCGAARKMFESKSREVAGFAQNQNYGLGGNSLTGNQKSILIYGSLLFFFLLFLSGYFLQ